jgi:enoyl-CoA hydratase
VEMPEVFAKLDADPHVRAIVLSGSGKNFSYGLDLPAMGGSLSGVVGGGGSARPRADFHATILRMQGAISAVADCRTPTIASVHGRSWAATSRRTGREDRARQRRLRRCRSLTGSRA